MGSKLKTLALVLMIVGVIGSLSIFFLGLMRYNDNKLYMPFASTNSYYYKFDEDDVKKGDIAYKGRTMMIYGGAGAIASIVGSLPLLWFGCLFERVEEIQELTAENNRLLEELKVKQKEAEE